jgi:hypothetical protein
MLHKDQFDTHMILRIDKGLKLDELSRSVFARGGTYLAVIKPCVVSPKSNLGAKCSRSLTEPSDVSLLTQMLLEVIYSEGQSQ